jgi:hypothetical protein
LNHIKAVGIIALVLGTIVVMVASYISFSEEQLTVEPFALGIAAILAGFVCFKKAKEV